MKEHSRYSEKEFFFSFHPHLKWAEVNKLKKEGSKPNRTYGNTRRGGIPDRHDRPGCARRSPGPTDWAHLEEETPTRAPPEPECQVWVSPAGWGEEWWPCLGSWVCSLLRLPLSAGPRCSKNPPLSYAGRNLLHLCKKGNLFLESQLVNQMLILGKNK